MNIFVTGGAGFIGRHLASLLLGKSLTVTIFDNFSNSNRKSTSTLSDNGVRVIEGDIMNCNDLTDAMKNHEIVIHLAAKISVDESIKNPDKTFHTNVDGTKNVIVACEKNKVKKLIVASSSAVYGDSLPGIKLTEESKTSPISPYGESKVLMEQEIENFASKHNIDCIILRFFNVYGVGQSPEYAGVITKFLEKIATNKPLEVFGDGTQTRDFVAVEDVVDSIYSAMLNGKNGIYNIASGKTITIKDLAEMMISLSGKNLQINYTDSKRGDIKHSQADISLAKKKIKYSPKFGLEHIKNLIE